MKLASLLKIIAILDYGKTLAPLGGRYVEVLLLFLRICPSPSKISLLLLKFEYVFKQKNVKLCLFQCFKKLHISFANLTVLNETKGKEPSVW